MTAARATPEGATLLRVWAVVQRARGALTPAQVAAEAGVSPDLASAALAWLVRQGRLQRWEDGRVCPATPGTACRLCSLRAWCPAVAESAEQHDA